MHAEARAFVRSIVDRMPPAQSVVEIGARYVNGTIKDLFAGCRDYTGVDLYPGLGVDVVADAAFWQPDQPVQLVVCCEVLEHTSTPGAIVTNALAMLAPGGHLILTCATDPRRPHSGFDGEKLRRSEHYANVDPEDLLGWLSGMRINQFERHQDRGDLYAFATVPLRDVVRQRDICAPQVWP